MVASIPSSVCLKNQLIYGIQKIHKGFVIIYHEIQSPLCHFERNALPRIKFRRFISRQFPRKNVSSGI